ncbi:MAG: hypothetical protein JW837_05265 [Sedimentisphaerales bacterium]|nr:hypothetical protein [Sedimentisphaerales bacterium]
MCRKLIYLVSIVLVLCLVGSVSAELVAHWRLDEGSGDTVHDLSGNGLDGIIHGNPKWVTGILGGALQFDGNGDYVDFGNDPVFDITEQITLAIWVNANDLNNGEHNCWLGKGDNTYAIKHQSGNNIEFFIYDGDWHSINYTTGLESLNGEWHHMAGTYDGEYLKLYIDGQLVDTVAYSSTIGTANHPVTMAENSQATGRFFDGMLDDARIYNHAMTEAEIPGIMSGSEAFPFALGPAPKDGSIHPQTWANISWTAGDFAVSHDVYFGDDFDAVNEGAEGTFAGNQTDTFIVVGFPGFPMPDGLVPGTTYYWRIDEVNEAEPNSPWKGPIWSFSIPPKTAYFPDPADEAEGVSIDERLSWTAGFGAKLHTVYFGETFEEVDNATGGSPQGTAIYSSGTLKMAKTYYWRVDEFDIAETHKGNVWSFTTEGAVSNPNPAKGAMDVSQTPVLTWEPGFGATYEIYFGTDAGALELKGSGSRGSESYEPGQLEWNTTYYWRVDEANSANADSPWTGPLWSFTTANFLIIDDFEAYNDLDPTNPASNRIFNIWIDGFEDPTNGSLVGYENPPFAEQTIVHSGNQSMPMYYDNSAGKSEATLTLTSNRDWTVRGVDTLTIWFRGRASNAAETLYITLNGSVKVSNDNPDAALRGEWTEWSIDLQTFADKGVNLADVNSITLGLDPVTGGTGTMYFDDIRLLLPAQ